MNEHWELHECNQLPPKGIQILYAMDRADRKVKTWRLIIRRGATYDDLMNNNIFTEEGETVWETYLEITHCPFCGKSLYEKPPTDLEDYGQFVHYDRGHWKSKRQ